MCIYIYIYIYIYMIWIGICKSVLRIHIWNILHFFPGHCVGIVLKEIMPRTLNFLHNCHFDLAYICQILHGYQYMWAQVEWWLEHRHGWLVKHHWVWSIFGWVSCDEYQVLGSTSIPARLDTLVFWEPFAWLTSVGTTWNTVIRLGWSRMDRLC